MTDVSVVPIKTGLLNYCTEDGRRCAASLFVFAIVILFFWYNLSLLFYGMCYDRVTGRRTVYTEVEGGVLIERYRRDSAEPYESYINYFDDFL